MAFMDNLALVSPLAAGYQAVTGTGDKSGGNPLQNFLFGTPSRTEQLQRFNPQQQQAFSQLLQNALSGMQNNDFSFAPLETKARQGFKQQTVPSIAERFTSMGGQRSSAFGQQLGQAASGLETNLAALGSQHGMQQQQILMNLLGLGLTPQFENVYHPEQQGFAQTGLAALIKILPLLLGA